MNNLLDSWTTPPAGGRVGAVDYVLRDLNEAIVSGVVRVGDRLPSEQALAARYGDDEDGRVTLVKLTEAGLKSVEHINVSIANCGARAIEGLSAKDIRTVVKLLKAIDTNLQ